MSVMLHNRLGTRSLRGAREKDGEREKKKERDLSVWSFTSPQSPSHKTSKTLCASSDTRTQMDEY